MKRHHHFRRILTGCVLLALLTLAIGSHMLSAASPPRQAGTLISTTQFIGLQTTTSKKGYRLTAALSPTPSGASSTTRSSNTLTVGPAAFAPPAGTSTSSTEMWSAY